MLPAVVFNRVGSGGGFSGCDLEKGREHRGKKQRTVRNSLSSPPPSPLLCLTYEVLGIWKIWRRCTERAKIVVGKYFCGEKEPTVLEIERICACVCGDDSNGWPLSFRASNKWAPPLSLFPFVPYAHAISMFPVTPPTPTAPTALLSVDHRPVVDKRSRTVPQG